MHEPDKVFSTPTSFPAVCVQRLAPLAQLTKVRILEFLREPEAIFWVFGFPILMTFALGIAFRAGVPERVPVGIVRSAGSDAVALALGRSSTIDARVLPQPRADIALRDGVVHLVVVPGTPPTYRYDPTRTESQLARLSVDQTLQREAGRTDIWRAREEQVVAPGSRYIDWLVPGLLGMNIMSTGLWGIGFSIVQARTRKLLKRLVASPMRRSDYLLAQMFGRLVFLVFEVAALVAFGWLVFRVPVRGSLVTLATVCVVGALSFGGLGLLLASRARTVEAVSGLLNLAMVPMWVLSGVFFSASRFPDAIQPVIRVLPLTALNDSLRAVMIDGRSITTLGSQTAVLAVWGCVSFAVALKIFRWR